MSLDVTNAMPHESCGDMGRELEALMDEAAYKDYVESLSAFDPPPEGEGHRRQAGEADLSPCRPRRHRCRCRLSRACRSCQLLQGPPTRLAR